MRVITDSKWVDLEAFDSEEGSKASFFGWWVFLIVKERILVFDGY